MFRPPNSSTHSQSPQSSFPDPFSATSVISVLKSPSNTSSLSPAAPSLFSLFCKKSAILTSSFSNPYALFKKECFANFLTINNFRTLSQNTRSADFFNPKASHIFHSRACAHTQQRPQPLSLQPFTSQFSVYAYFASLPPIFSAPPAKPSAAAERRDVLSASAFLHRLLRHAASPLEGKVGLKNE